MAISYVTPPTFVDATALSAAQLNILSADIEYLQGLIDTVNIPFSSVGYIAGTMSEQAEWRIRHRHRYLLYSLSINATFNTGLYLRYNHIDVYSRVMGGDPVSMTLTSYVDLQPLNLTVGTWYQINWAATILDGACVAIYLIESPLNSF